MMAVSQWPPFAKFCKNEFRLFSERQIQTILKCLFFIGWEQWRCTDLIEIHTGCVDGQESVLEKKSFEPNGREGHP